jgi:group II intron reverse transcriptase/maturase
VDGLTWEAYEADLDPRIEDLHSRLHRGAYRAQPARRRFIPKPDGIRRPLAVVALEDKVVQRATAAVLGVIYEEKLFGFSYGFRPKRSQQEALDALIVGISGTKVDFILDADIRSLFNEVSQEWLVRFVQHRIDDPRIVRLIQKWLKAGILEDGEQVVSEKGTGQGSVISRLLAKLYLHYVFDLWADRCRRRKATGNMVMVRYADDIVVGFERETDARRFWEEMRERLREFSLTLHPEKTRLIEFGRHAAANRGRQDRRPALFLASRDLREIASGQVPPQEENPTRPHARETPGNQGRVAAPATSTNPKAGRLVETSRHRLFRVPCRPDKRTGYKRVSLPRHHILAPGASATEPERQDAVGADEKACGRLAANAAHPSSLAKRTLRRQTPKVGAGCPNWLVRFCAGGRSEMSVPTANAVIAQCLCAPQRGRYWPRKGVAPGSDLTYQISSRLGSCA